MRARWASLRDHYAHYRQKVGLGPLASALRAVYHEVTGRDWRRSDASGDR